MLASAAALSVRTAQDEIRFAFGESSLGLVLVGVSEKGVRTIFLGDERDALRSALEHRYPRARLKSAAGDLDGAVREVVALIENPRRGFDPPLDVRGTSFQERVWDALRRIPVGKTATYAEIARSIGAPQAVRAIAQACGANPLAVVIPCHRVLRSDGDISGYRWGVERKRQLLARERLA